MKHCGTDTKAALIVLYDIGMRAGELCRLTWNDIDFQGGVIHVREGKTDAAERKIPITERVREVLMRRMASDALIRRADAGFSPRFVFTRHRGTGPLDMATAPLTVGALSHRFTAARRHAKIRETVVLHSTRHSYLTRLAATGIDLSTFRQIAGHASTVISQRYVHVKDDSIRAAGLLLQSQNPIQNPIQVSEKSAIGVGLS